MQTAQRESRVYRKYHWSIIDSKRETENKCIERKEILSNFSSREKRLLAIVSDFKST